MVEGVVHLTERKPLLDNLPGQKPIVKKSVLHTKSFQKELHEYSKMGRTLISELVWYVFGIDV